MAEKKKDPFILFKKWFDEAQTLDVEEPTAMVLSTASKEGVPTSRVILLKGYDERGFCFYTNMTSNKGKNLQENPHVSLCFYWDKPGRQVRIEGKAERVAEHEADAYFITRSRNSQIGAWASNQSSVMEHEDDLKKRFDEMATQFKGQDVPRPPFWTGFRVVPHKIEFWEKRDFRLHKRTVYNKTASTWKTETIYP